MQVCHVTRARLQLLPNIQPKPNTSILAVLAIQDFGKTSGVDPGMEGVSTPLKYVGGVRVCFDPLKCLILSFKTVVG